MAEADESTQDEHSCQPPQEQPGPGAESCPECGTRWRIEDAAEHPENLPADRDQRVNWVRVEKPNS